MATTVSATDTEVTNPVNNYYKRKLLDNIAPVMAYFAGTQKGQLEKKQGTSTIKFRRFNPINPDTSGGNAAPTSLSELTGNASYMQGRDARAISMTDYTANVLKYGEFVILNEEVDLYNPNQMAAETVIELGRTGAKGLNRVQRNVAEDNLAKVYASGVANDAAIVNKITAADLKKVINNLNSEDVEAFSPMSAGSDRVGSTPILEAYWGITHPDVAEDLVDIAGFKSVDTYAAHVETMPNEVGAYQRAGKAIRFIQTPESTIDIDTGGAVAATGLESDGGSNVDVYNTVVYGKGCIGSIGLGKEHTDGIYRADGSAMDSIEIIQKGLGSGGTSDPFDEIQTVSVKYFHAGLVLDPVRGFNIRTGATAL